MSYKHIFIKLGVHITVSDSHFFELKISFFFVFFIFFEKLEIAKNLRTPVGSACPGMHKKNRFLEKKLAGGKAGRLIVFLVADD